MKCHAGCDTTDIVAALDLKMEDLFEEPMQEVARYRYHSNGRFFDKVRLASGDRKTFRWEPSLNGHKMPLYRLEDARALPDPVYVIESEKDVDRLLGMGVAATCMPGGAGSWRDEYTEALRGRDVIIVADRDEPGVKHALKVKESLGGRIVQSRTEDEHDDVGDHLDAGFTLDQLVPYRPGVTGRYVLVNWATAFKEQPEEIDWLKEDFLVAGTLNTMYSKPGIGKSLISLEIALEVMRAGHCVMYIDDENRLCDVIERLQAFGCKSSDLDGLLYLSFGGLPALDSPEGGLHLTALAEEYKPRLVIMDTISRMVSGEENMADTWNQLYRCSLVPLKARGIAMLRLDHSGKDDHRGMRGSSSKEGDVDYVWRLARDGERMFTLECQKSRTGHIAFGQIIALERKYEPLRHVWDVKVEIPLSQYQGIITQMDRLGISPSYGRERTRTLLKQAGVTSMRNDQLQAAIIERRNRVRRELVPVPGTSGDQGTRGINLETGEVEVPF